MSNIADEICQLEQEVAAFGIDMAIRFSPPALWLDRIKRTTGAPGSGERALVRLFALADRHGLPIHAVAEDFPAVASLLEYYERLGFTIIAVPEYGDEEDEPAGDLHYEIVRLPH